MRPTYYFRGKQVFVIKDLMKKANLKQTDIASKLNVSRAYINAMINGNKPISSKLKLELEKALDIKLTTQKKQAIYYY